MRRPAIITVDDDALVSAAISRDLRSRYGAVYQTLTATSGQQALELLARLALRDQPVALIASDQRMPQMTGIEMLAAARPTVPDAKFLLLTAYADTDVAIQAINDIGLDYYLLKPWDPPEGRLYPVVDGLLSDWADAHPDHGSDVRVVGQRWSDRSYEIKSFLTRNHVPYRWLDIERDDEAGRLVTAAKAAPGALPLVITPDGTSIAAPSTLALAEALGLRTQATQPLYDVCIVGAGPAGLAAAVYAASEGLATVVVEREAPGGQAGQSAAGAGCVDARAAHRVVSVRRAPARGHVRHRSRHRIDGAATRVAGPAGHAGGWAGARAEQPRCGRDPRGGRAEGVDRVGTRVAGRPQCGADHGRSVCRARCDP